MLHGGWPEHYSRTLCHPPRAIESGIVIPDAPDALLSTLLRNVLTSRVYQVIPSETPLDVAPRLSRRLRNEVLVKREDLLPVFSFKLRGAYNKVAYLEERDWARGIITASAGNHAQGVAFSGQRLG